MPAVDRNACQPGTVVDSQHTLQTPANYKFADGRYRWAVNQVLDAVRPTWPAMRPGPAWHRRKLCNRVVGQMSLLKPVTGSTGPLVALTLGYCPLEALVLRINNDVVATLVRSQGDFGYPGRFLKVVVLAHLGTL